MEMSKVLFISKLLKECWEEKKKQKRRRNLTEKEKKKRLNIEGPVCKWGSINLSTNQINEANGSFPGRERKKEKAGWGDNCTANPSFDSFP